jgi:hypothetical protein
LVNLVALRIQPLAVTTLQENGLERAFIGRIFDARADQQTAVHPLRAGARFQFATLSADYRVILFARGVAPGFGAGGCLALAARAAERSADQAAHHTGCRLFPRTDFAHPLARPHRDRRHGVGGRGVPRLPRYRRLLRQRTNRPG